MKKESNIQNAVRLALSSRGVLNFRNNTGAYKTEQGHYVRYGVGEKGGSDLICVTPITITPAMVGRTVGVFTALEVKTKTGRATDSQVQFIKAIKNIGGIAGIVRDPQGAIKIIEEWVGEQ